MQKMIKKIYKYLLLVPLNHKELNTALNKYKFNQNIRSTNEQHLNTRSYYNNNKVRANQRPGVRLEAVFCRSLICLFVQSWLRYSYNQKSEDLQNYT